MFTLLFCRQFSLHLLHLDKLSFWEEICLLHPLQNMLVKFSTGESLSTLYFLALNLVVISLCAYAMITSIEDNVRNKWGGGS